MSPTSEDVLAARALIGGPVGGESHENMAGLEGADLCVHPLTGSGRNISTDETRKELGPQVCRQWEAKPYRHHVYEPVPVTNIDPRIQVSCKCGNYPGGPVHQRCWEEGHYNGK